MSINDTLANCNERLNRNYAKKRLTGKIEENLKNDSKFSHDLKPNNNSMKIIGSLFLIITMPNFVMVLIHVARKCNSSFLEFFMDFTEKSITEIFSEVWLKDEFDMKFGISIILVYWAFALLLMIVVPGKIVSGSRTPKGNVPLYKDNGFYCYLLTLLVFGVLSYYLPQHSSFSVSIIYAKFPSIIGCLSIFSLGFCLLLYLKGIYFPNCPDSIISGNFIFDFYWGIETHPRIRNIDIKVFTNCRFGMTVWLLIVLSFFKYSVEVGSVHNGLILNVVLQALYITKFFWWEAGYYNTMDINVDHAGFYICWGCLTFLPCLFSLSTYSMITQYTIMPNIYYIAILVIGLLSLVLNYWADYQKQIVRSTNGKCLIWNKPAQIIEATYIDLNGAKKKSILITSGFWGLARHFHYFPELMLAFCWCATSGIQNLLTFSYFVFLLLLLLHRLHRDNEKCTLKYGKYYEEYKKLVPWKMIPYVF